MKSRAQMLSELRQMLHDVFVARERGTAHPQMARVHGYVDGYMRALLDCGLATKEELLVMVAEERTTVSGPATLVISSTAA
ncbi:MAG TPA: hypothetical protein VFB62_04675 [Polyangiaceae bacterium]|nr:hypothetical protein [Polyangiaceae bacterium]